MINRQQGFTLLEVMAALAIFSMLSVLAFMIFSQASELHQRSQKEIQQFNQLQRTITILDNDLLQLVARRNRSTDKIMVLGEEAIFTTQSRDPLAPLSEAQTLLTVHWYLRNHTLYRAVRTSVDGRNGRLRRSVSLPPQLISHPWSRLRCLRRWSLLLRPAPARWRRLYDLQWHQFL